ncbi:MAG: fasciclin domain-containing protein [Bacteroidaceae bacterium]|nr:fasciclin domain-containing protein [Bacteroidaceae bacterium]
MRNHFSRNGRHTTLVVCLLIMCGLNWSCKDEYILDDEKPTWLNSSVYQSLQERGNFNTYLELLSDSVVNSTLSRKLQEVLSRTGSKTVFVANDSAWEAFFRHNATLPASNPWHNATSLKNLSLAQKKLLIHTSMLNNAIVMENLASSDGDGTTPPTRGQYMRRYTDVTLTDSIMYLPASEVPYTTNDEEKNFWRRFREGGTHPGIYLVNDSTLSMMLHFTQEHMSNNSILDSDFKIFMGSDRNSSDVHIYDALLLEKDGVCENGYVNVTEKVIVPLPNMAEMLRINGQTNIFSHMIDRFSFPAYNAAVTRDYKTLHPEFTDSIFTKKYIAKIGAKHQTVLTTPKEGGLGADIALKFDPGWNEYYDEENDPRPDMASMFVPSDEALVNYFTKSGGGWQLIKTYAANPEAELPDDMLETGNFTPLYEKIDAIPLDKMQSLINVIMFRSFTESVPSKMYKLRDDAQEEMFSTTDINMIDTCLLANNGAIYIMNKVYGPADFTSVAAPAFISKTNKVINYAIYNGQIEKTDFMKLNYYAYLKAMKSRFTFFLPSDYAMQYYYDPISMSSQSPTILALAFNDKAETADFPISYRIYRYDKTTGERGAVRPNETTENNDIINRLKDILESHTIVHDGSNPIDSEDEYYLTKNGSGIKVTRDANNNIIGVQGGFQLENERRMNKGLFVPGTTERGASNVEVLATNTHNLDNGRTYVLDEAPIIPATTSVYGILNEDTSATNPFREFCNLTAYNDEVITACGLVDDKLTQTQKNALLKKYHTFVDDGGVDQNVQFFNNYNYTLFAPDNEAVQAAIDEGLPTWDDIIDDYESLKDTDGVAHLTAKDSLRLQTKITYLNNFIRVHFTDNSIFSDKSEMDETDFVTSSYDDSLGVFVKVHCQRVAGGSGTLLKVRDDIDASSTQFTVNNNYKNLMTRDVRCVKDGKAYSPTGRITMNGITIQASSSAVVHLINGTLRHSKNMPDFNNIKDCKRYLKRYPIYKSQRDEQSRMLMKQSMYKRY